MENKTPKISVRLDNNLGTQIRSQPQSLFNKAVPLNYVMNVPLNDNTKRAKRYSNAAFFHSPKLITSEKYG